MEEQELKPRNYQVALLEKCSESNTIIFLPTGAGKTFIAILALKRLAADFIGENHKVCIMLVNTVALVDQHTKYVRQHTPFECSGYSGEMNTDFWKADVWSKEFKKNHVLVMTTEIFTGIVRGSIVDLNQVNLLLFDECHHAVNDHSMRQLMMNFENLSRPPRVIGLTATLLNGNCKPYKVMDEVKSLEITLQSKVATVDGLEQVVGFATNPKEIFIEYHPYVLSIVEEQCLESVDKLLNTLTSINVFKQENNDRLKNSNLELLDPGNDVKILINILKDLKVHMNFLGIYGSKIACVAYMIRIQRMRKNCNNLAMAVILSSILTVLGNIASRLINVMKDCTSEKECFYKYSSDRVLKLAEIFGHFKKTSTEPLCGLVFVERRFTAKIIYNILDNLCKSDNEFNHIRPDFIIGNNNNPLIETRENLFISKKNKQVLEKFANKELNLLCTSQVLEEGVDMPKCTMVCKFDLPKDYRSYIQSKGRARHKKSHYYLLVQSDKKDEFVEKYRQFQLIEKILNDFLIGKNDERDGPCKDEIDKLYNESILPNFYVNGIGSAYISEVSAIPLLCRYCQNLPADQYTFHSPEWYLEKITQGVDLLYSVVILLPTVCPLEDPIKGMPMPNKKMAKRAAAYEACIKLYQCGELTDSLLPVSHEAPEEDISYLFEHYPKVKEIGAGTKKVRFHNIEIPIPIYGELKESTPLHLHMINLEPLFNRENDIHTSTLYDMYTSNTCFGILTPKPLPNICGFPIYVTNGTIMVYIVNNINKIDLTKEDLLKIREFNFTIYNDILEVLNPFLIMDNTNQAESMILVPIKKDECVIDFDILEKHRTIKNVNTPLSHSDKVNLEVEEDSYMHKIVIPTYRRDTTSYLVTNICWDMTPKSSFPNESFDDFVNYYQDKHQIHVINLKQPLLLVKGLSHKMNLYKPSGIDKKRKKVKMYEELQEYLIPEMLVKQDFPASLWIQSRFIPTILSRLTYMLKVEQLRQKINKDCGFILKTFNMRPIELNLNLLNYDPVCDEKEFQNRINVNYEKSEEILAICSSFKTTSCNRDFQTKVLESKYPWKDLDEPKDINRSLDVSVMDIEAYENFINLKVTEKERQTVYKSPLKQKYPALTYNKEFVMKTIKLLEEDNCSGIIELADLYEAMTTAKANDIVNLERLETLGDSFLKYIVTFYIYLRFPIYNEGRSTSLKGRLISNKNLFYLAQKHKFGGIMKNRNLMPKDEWLPPGFCVPKLIQKKINEKILSPDCLFKCEFTKEERLSGIVNEKELFEEIYDSEYVHDEEDNSSQNMDQFLKQQCLKDKCLADVVEAIIGTYLQNTGINGCLKLIHWIGIIPPSEDLENFFKQTLPNPLLKTAASSDILFHIPSLNDIEKIIQYEFKNKAYLLQALTHASYTPNRLTKSYERLEFLGDAILDFLITCFIYESCDNLTPGDLTDLRSALVNNNTFASYVVRLGLHKYLLMINSTLQNHMDKFVEYMVMKNYEIDDEVLILLQNEDMDLAECVDVPKVLGDIFEALAAAVFLDSGCCLKTVWNVFYKIMWREIDLFSKVVPKNMVRKLFESDGAYPQFGNAVATDNGKVMVKLNFYAQGIPKHVYGFGSNKIQAKKAAAKIALRYL